MKNSAIKRIVILILAIAILIGSIFIIRSCSAPPEYSEIEARFKELLKNSEDLNVIFFGDGLDTYDRVYEPSTQLYTDAQSGKKYYYYTVEDKELGTVYVHKYSESLFYYGTKTKLEDKEHVYLDKDKVYYYEIEDYDPGENKGKINEFKDPASGEVYYFYLLEDETYKEVYKYNKQMIKYIVGEDKKREDVEPIYTDAAKGIYYYYIEEFTEPEYEFYYTSTDDKSYSYVRDDAKYTSIAQIKQKAQSVYSRNYLNSLYVSLFDGYGSVPPRYMDNANNGRLMQYDNYESLVSEKCEFMFETAKIDEWQSNSSLVRINIKAYLPSRPSEKHDIVIDLALQDGEWYLDSPTYIADGADPNMGAPASCGMALNETGIVVLAVAAIACLVSSTRIKKKQRD